MSKTLTFKMFDVSQGSCNLIISPTGKTELIDFGAETDWSPVAHVFAHYVPGGTLSRLVLTHHHGDHLSDWDNLKDKSVDLVLRRNFSGRYKAACKASNLPEGHKTAEAFHHHFLTHNHEPDPVKVSPETWGVAIETRSLSVGSADSVSATDNATANNCSFVRLYDHSGTKILVAGDMEKEGTALLLSSNPQFKRMLKGVDVLITPHHGHKSGFSTDLMSAIGKPRIVLASMKTGNKNVDGRYSSEEFVEGLSFDDGTTKRLLTTRSNGAITVTSSGGGNLSIRTQQR